MYGLSHGVCTQDINRTDELVLLNEYQFTAPRSSTHCVSYYKISASDSAVNLPLVKDSLPDGFDANDSETARVQVLLVARSHSSILMCCTWTRVIMCT